MNWTQQATSTWVSAKDFDDYTPIRAYFAKKQLGNNQDYVNVDQVDGVASKPKPKTKKGRGRPSKRK